MTVEENVVDLPLTAKERAQWALHRLSPDLGVNNIGLALQVPTRLCHRSLQQALDQLVRRHPALRATLVTDGDDVRRRILDPMLVSVALDTVDGTAETVAELMSAETERPFELDGGLLVRAKVIATSETSTVVITMHHLVVDATSVPIILDEVTRLYDLYADAEPLPDELAAVAPVFVEPPVEPATHAYWQARLAGLEPARAVLAGARDTPDRPTFCGGRVAHRLGPAAVDAVRRLRQQAKASENLVLLAAFLAILAQHGAGPDLAVGVPVNARRPPRTPVVGYHVNTLPIRVHVDAERGFAALVRDVRQEFLEGLQHGAISYEAMDLPPEVRGPDWRVPVFRHLFNAWSLPPAQLNMAGCPVRLVEAEIKRSRLDLEWTVVADDGLDISVIYNSEVHDRAQIGALISRYEALLLAAVAAPERPLRDLDVLTAADQRLLAQLNDTARTWPAQTVAELVASQVRHAPDATAIDEGRSVTTYAQLAAMGEGVRLALEAHGVRAGDVIGLCAARGPWLAAAVLGVWTAGAAYVPLDPQHPAERIAYQLDHTGATVILTDGPSGPWCGDRAVITLGTIAPAAPTVASEGVQPHRPAYVIFTSGSTGSPKGVVVRHVSLANQVQHFAELLGAAATARVLWLTTFTFDPSTLELFLALATGGRLAVAPDAVRHDAAAFARTLERTRATLVQATPTTLHEIVDGLTGAATGITVLTGGEPLTSALADRLRSHGVRLYQVYGPTETTVWATVAQIQAPCPERPGIGGPIANTDVEVRDAQGRRVPPGVPGELYIGGVGVAIGYHGAPAMTRDRFPVGADGRRRYRTGDIVRVLPTGLEFLGRRDRQVKIRGNRIELAEVERALEADPRVARAAVVVRPDASGQPSLAAACRLHTPTDDPAVLTGQVRSGVTQRLPSSMVPGYLVFPPELPLTTTGKVDYAALSAMLHDGPDERQAEPVDDPVLGQLTVLWREVLDDPTVDAGSDFFMHGGQSLLAIQLIERINATFGTDLEFQAVFGAPTPARMRSWVSDQEPAASVAGTSVEITSR